MASSTVSSKQVSPSEIVLAYVRAFPKKYVRAKIEIPKTFRPTYGSRSEELTWHSIDQFGVFHQIDKPNYVEIVEWYEQNSKLDEDIKLSGKFISDLEGTLMSTCKIYDYSIKTSIMPFKNGIFDMEKQELRVGTCNDMIKKTFGREYKNPSPSELEATQKLLRDVLGSTSAVTTLVKRLRQAVLLDQDQVLVFFGTGGNGKTTLMQHIQNVFDLLCVFVRNNIETIEFNIYSRIMMAQESESIDEIQDLLTLISNLQRKLGQHQFRTILYTTNNINMVEYLRRKFKPEECEIFYFPNKFTKSSVDPIANLNPNALFSMVCGSIQEDRASSSTPSSSASGSSTQIVTSGGQTPC